MHPGFQNMAFKTSPKLSILAVLLSFSMMISNLYLALAASGGVVGGSSSGSSSSSSSSSIPVIYNTSTNDGDDKSSLIVVYVVFAIFLMLGVVFCRYLSRFIRKGESVIMLQVGLLGEARLIQRNLNQIALTADTSNMKHLHCILRKTTSALLQHPTYCISGYSSVDWNKDWESMEKRFNKLSHEEREKFDIETLVNVNNVKVQRTFVPKVNKLGDKYIVVTILVKANGAHELPVIKDGKSLKEALQYLGSIDSSKITAVHVLWTPQNEDDALVVDELLENYPLLKPISESVLDLSIEKGVATPGFS